MWTIWESRSVEKALDKLQNDIVERYELWKSIARTNGPEGIAAFPPFKDHPLKGNLKGYRSSRLKDKWKVIYKIENEKLIISAVEISPDDYRRV
jgi:addiction module RelE/StbE family toxin